MKVVTIGDATLYCGDCRDIIPLLDSIDAVVTDAPYGYGEPSGTMGKGSKKRDYLSFEDTPENVRDICVPAFIDALSIAKRGAITPGNRCAFFYPHPDAMGSFYQPAATGMCRWGRSTSQPILFYGDDPRLGKTIDRTSQQLTERASTDEHPCAKPMKAWKWLTWKLSLEGETILDPFMGSGTTGVAAMELGCKFIGIEVEPKYFDVACKRIEEAQRQKDLFIGRASK